MKKKHINLGLGYVANMHDLRDEPQYAAIVKRAEKLLHKAAKALKTGKVADIKDWCGSGPRIAIVMTHKESEKSSDILDEIEAFLECTGEPL